MNNKVLVVYSEPSGLTNTVVHSSLITHVNDLDSNIKYISASELEGCKDLLDSSDRVVFQFPIYWYSCPTEMKNWIDNVLSYSDLDRWIGKSFGIVLIAGVHTKEYSREGREYYSIDEISIPFYALANRFKWVTNGALSIHQMRGMTEETRVLALSTYHSYLKGEWDKGTVSI